MLIHYPEGTSGRLKASKPDSEIKPVTPQKTEVTRTKIPHGTPISREQKNQIKKTEDHKPTAETAPSTETEQEAKYPTWFLERYTPAQIERAEKLGKLMGEIAAQQNNWLKKECGIKFDLLNKYGAIDVRIFAANNGGPTPDAIAQKDKSYVETAERALADICLPPADRTPEVEKQEKKALLAKRRARMKRYKIPLKEDEQNSGAVDKKLLEGFRLERAMTESFQLEKAFVITFAKLIGPEYIVCRSTDYDDYKGVDTFIIDTKTGQVVCALDEVFDKYTDNARRNDGENERVKQKISTTVNTNRKGGKHIEYGARIYEQDGRKKLTRESIDNVPFFYVAITKAELDSVVENYTQETDLTMVSPAELTFFKTVLQSWREQIAAIPDPKPGAQTRHSKHPITKQQLEKTFQDLETLAKRFERNV